MKVVDEKKGVFVSKIFALHTHLLQLSRVLHELVSHFGIHQKATKTGLFGEVRLTARLKAGSPTGDG